MDMDTATRSQRVFLSVAGFIYASFGFSLSVITALFNLLFHSNAQHELILTLPSHPKPAHHHHAHHHGTHARPRRLIRSTSEHSIKAPPLAPEPLPSGQRSQASPSEKTIVSYRKSLAAESSSLKSIHSVLETTANEKSPEPFSGKQKRSLFTVHGRSRSESTPTIMVGHHDSTEHVSWKMPDTLTEEPAQMSTPNLPLTPSQSAQPPPSSAQTASTVKSSSCPWSAIKATPRLFVPKTWGNHKRLKRCQSSPQLCEPPGVPFAPSPPRKSPGSDSESPPPQDLKKPKSWKHLRKAKSGPFDEKAIPKAERKSDKKRSQTLRTHPYEAPYFAPPPVPTVPVHIALVPDHTSSDYASSIDSTKSSLGKKSSKTLTKS